jgi:hypothetical protein
MKPHKILCNFTENENNILSFKKIIFIGSKNSEKTLFINKLLLNLNSDYKDEISITNFQSKEKVLFRLNYF